MFGAVSKTSTGDPEYISQRNLLYRTNTSEQHLWHLIAFPHTSNCFSCGIWQMFRQILVQLEISHIHGMTNPLNPYQQPSHMVLIAPPISPNACCTDWLKMNVQTTPLQHLYLTLTPTQMTSFMALTSWRSHWITTLTHHSTEYRQFQTSQMGV